MEVEVSEPGSKGPHLFPKEKWESKKKKHDLRCHALTNQNQRRGCKRSMFPVICLFKHQIAKSSKTRPHHNAHCSLEVLGNVLIHSHSLSVTQAQDHKLCFGFISDSTESRSTREMIKEYVPISSLQKPQMSCSLRISAVITGSQSPGVVFSQENNRGCLMALSSIEAASS